MKLKINEDNLIEWNNVKLASDDSAVATGTFAWKLLDSGRTITDAVTTAASKTITSATGAFTAADVGSRVLGRGMVDGTTIEYVDSTTQIRVVDAATLTQTAAELTIAKVLGTGSMTCVDSSPATWQGTIPKTDVDGILVGDTGTIEVTAASGSNDGFRVIDWVGEYHKAGC